MKSKQKNLKKTKSKWIVDGVDIRAMLITMALMTAIAFTLNYFF